jgi:DtxR family transcriptional regulator, Mn-dependent transcriptional regulator
MQSTDKLLSDSKEMYLVTIARLGEPGQPVPLSHLANELSVTSASVNEMCRKLQDQGYLIYQPYQGAWLTETGEKLANKTLRQHRLWEVFLVDKLGFDFSSAHQIACQMEHVTTAQLMDKLDQYLGYPKVNPIGYPIPSSNFESTQAIVCPLSDLSVGSRACVIRSDIPESVAGFLEDSGLLPGKEITLMGVGNNNLLIQVDQVYVTLSVEVAQSIRITQLDSEKIN